MRKITKKTLQRIKEGYHNDLMEAIDFLLDTYNEDKFDDGYKSCLEDMSVKSYRLAEYIIKKIPILEVDTDFLAGVIEEYFNKALK